MQGKLNARLIFSIALCAACVGCSSESADWCKGVTEPSTSCKLEDGTEIENGQGYCKDSSTYTKCTNGRFIDDQCGPDECRADGCLVSPVQCTKDSTEYAPGTGYCDADGKSIICGTDGQWLSAVACESTQVCSKDGCIDGKPCGTTKHGDKVCNDHTDIYVCENGTLKPEATDANGNVVSCPRNHVCDTNEENPEVACRQVECTPNALACAGEQFQLCGDDEKWGDPKDMPEGFNATCKDKENDDDDDEVPTCASDSLTTSYCDDTVAMNCALYTETGKEGQVEWSKCGDGFICDKDAASSTYHTCIPEPCNANEKDYVRCKLGTYQTCDGTSWSIPATIPESVDVNCKQDDPNEPGVIVCKEEGVYEDNYCGDSHVFSCSGEGAEIIKVTPGYCDGEGQYVECKDNAWEDPDKCSEHNQICSANGCRDPKPCNETTQHGDKVCIEETKIYVCEDGTLKPEKVDDDGNAVSCLPRHECTPPEDNPKAVVCYPVDCTTNELACAGEQFQLCVNKKWDTPKDMPEGFNATCKDKENETDDDEVPTCASDSLTTSYCDDYVAMNCALYTETGKEGHVDKSKCGEGFVCDMNDGSATYHTCIPEPCNANEKDHVRCKLDTYQVCDGTSWSVPATIPKSVDVSCKQGDDPNEPGVIQCKEEGVYEDRYCGDSYVFTCEGPEDIIETVTSGYCDGEGQYVECKDNDWEDPDKCSDHNQVCSANGCRDGKDCDEDHKHGDKYCTDHNKIEVCDDGARKPEAVDTNGNPVLCPPNYVCDPNEENPEVACRPTECTTKALTCAGEQYQLCVNEKWDTPKDMPTGFNATCTGGDDEVPTCDPDHLTENYCDDYVAMNCALYTETGKEGHVAKSTCGEGFVCDMTAHACIPEPCTGEQKDHVRCNGITFQICDGSSWSIPAKLTDNMQSIVTCKDDTPDKPGVLVCNDDPGASKTACSHVIPDIQGNLVSLEINCTDHTASTPKMIEISTCGNSLECYNASTLTGTCGPEKCDAAEENKLRCSEDLKQICKGGIWRTLDTVISGIPDGLLLCKDDDDDDGDDEVICNDTKEHCAAYGTDTTLVLACNASGEEATVHENCDGVAVCCEDETLCKNNMHTCVECRNDDQCNVPTPACNPDTNQCVTCIEDTHCVLDGMPYKETRQACINNTCDVCRDGRVRCLTAADEGTKLQTSNSTLYEVKENDAGKITVCSGGVWKIMMEIPGDADTVFVCNGNKLECLKEGSYCQKEMFYTPNLALICDEDADDYPNAKGDLACPTGMNICHPDRHICMTCNPGDIQCDGGGYQICDANGQWGITNDLPSTGIVECNDDKQLQCATGHENDSYCATDFKVNCPVLSSSSPVVEKSSCMNHSDICTTDNKCDETCVNGDVRCVGSTDYQTCVGGTWSTTPSALTSLPPDAQELLEDTCTNEPRCKENGEYCTEDFFLKCYKQQTPLIMAGCPYSCDLTKHKCNPNPVDPCDALRETCAAAGKVCELLPNGEAACWYKETFDYDAPYPSTFAIEGLNLSYEITTSETNPKCSDPSNATYCGPDLNETNNHGKLYREFSEEEFFDYTKGHDVDQGWMRYVSWAVKHGENELWHFAHHGQRYHSYPKTSNVTTTGNLIMMTNRAEMNCHVHEKAGEDGVIKLEQDRCWRNWFEISEFKGGVSMFAFTYRTWSNTIIDGTQLPDNPDAYYRQHIKFRIYLDNSDIPVAVLVTIPALNDGTVPKNPPESEVVFDFTRMVLPEGIDLKSVKKITVRPEYVNLDGQAGGNYTIFGQTSIDNIRWVSAE